MGVPYAEVIGDPIAHSKSPIIHKFWLEKLGLDYDFRQTRVEKNELADFIGQRRADPEWCGCNVTIPHKIAMAGIVDELATAAGIVGAVNCVTRSGAQEPRLIGHNTDIAGFLEPLQPLLNRALGRFATVFGTGGAAAGITYALDRSGFVVFSVGRDKEKAIDLRQRLGLDHHVEVASISEFAKPRRVKSGDRSGVLDLLVNATPLGMAGFPPLPVNLAGEPPNLVVYDAVYQPLETTLLRDARERGMHVIDGLQMLVGQAAAAFELFFMEKPPREHDDELRALLTQ